MPPQRVQTLLGLPEAVLEGILAHLDQKTRASALPLVCRTFRRLLSGPSACLWPDITFAVDLSQPGQPERCSNFLAWLARHGALSRTLELDIGSVAINEPALLPPGMGLGDQLEEALYACLASCTFLRLRWGGPELVVGAWITSAASLTCLALSGHELKLRSCCSQLTGLAHLELSTVSDAGPQLEPGCLPASITRLCCVPAPGAILDDEEAGGLVVSSLPEQLLALPRLQYLDVSDSWFVKEHLEEALPRLTRLTSLAFDKGELPAGLPSALSLLTRLAVLSFDGCIISAGDPQTVGTWAVLGSLSNLMSLSLSNCNLTHLPTSVVALPRMQHLYLEFNAIRCLPSGPYLAHLLVLSLDWEPLMRCHQMLMLQCPHLWKLALGNMSIYVHEQQGLPPLSTSGELLESLRYHPKLREILLIVRPTHVSGDFVPVLEALLQLGSLRPGLAVRPVQHDAFFVEDAPELIAAEDGPDGGAGGGAGSGNGHAALLQLAAAADGVDAANS